MSDDAFTAIKEKLLHCPTCGGSLFDSPDNAAIRTCLVHGNVFAIMRGANEKFVVAVGLG